MKICAVIPAYNEEVNIGEVVLKAVNYVDCVVVVDDGSSDNTYKNSLALRKNNATIHVLRHPLNAGKGAALKTGSEYAIQQGADAFIYLDADGQHNPEDIARFVQRMEETGSDLVFGSRTIGRDMPFVMMVGNKFLSLATSLLFGTYISDTQSGFRLLTKKAFSKLKWRSSSYAVETEMITKIKKQKIEFSEITINTIYKDDYKGTTIIDGVRIFLQMLKWKLQ